MDNAPFTFHVSLFLYVPRRWVQLTRIENSLHFDTLKVDMVSCTKTKVFILMRVSVKMQDNLRGYVFIMDPLIAQKERSKMSVSPSYESLIGRRFSLAGKIYLTEDQGVRWISDPAVYNNLFLDWSGIEALDGSSANLQDVRAFNQAPVGPLLTDGTKLAKVPNAPEVPRDAQRDDSEQAKRGLATV